MFQHDTETAQRPSDGKGSLVIIILLMLHSLPDGHHLSFPPSPSPFPRIPVFISSLSATDFFILFYLFFYYVFIYFFFASLGQQTRSGKRESDEDEASGDKKKLETETDRRAGLSESRDKLRLSHIWESL